MADEEKKEENSGGEEKKKGGNTVLIIVVVVLVLLLIVGGVVAFLLMSSNDEESENGNSANNNSGKSEQNKKRSKKSVQRNLEALTVGPMYTLEKFQVNLLSNSGKRFLVTELQLEMESEDVMPELDTKKAVIRDHIISILSSKNIEEVSTPKGKDKL